MFSSLKKSPPLAVSIRYKIFCSPIMNKLGFVDVVRPPVISKKNTSTPLKKQEFSYLLVLDFEATCWGDGSEKWRGNEIIEFPVVLLEVCSGRVVAEFHHYVRPTQRPVLAPFCVELTGIKQKTADAGLPLQQCLDEFENWLTEQQERYKFTVYTQDDDTLKLLRRQLRGTEPTAGGGGSAEGKKAAIVTWTDWDIKTCLQEECKRKRMPLPLTFSRWIDLKGIFKIQCPDAPAYSLSACLEAVGMKFTGRPHSGISDARNTAALAVKLMHEGAVLSVTGGVGGSIS